MKLVPSSYWLPKFDSYKKRGLPDIVGCVNGFFIALELKLDDAPKDPKRELLQEYEIMKILAAGAMIAHARVTPSVWLEFEDYIYDLVDNRPTPKN